jgi:diaminopimelate epimerase
VEAITMVKLEFFKICTAGNDFIVIDNRKRLFNVDYNNNIVEMLCARRYAIGADGLCFIEPSTSADYSVRFFTPDGIEQGFGVNGIRAAIRFASEKEIATGNVHTIETKAGIVKGEVSEEIIGVHAPKAKKIEIKHELEIPHQFESRLVELSFVDFGVKHLVLRVEKVSTFDIKGIGSMLANHVRYQPEGIDVTFYDVIDVHKINTASYEFGVNNIVFSSGNGILASVMVGEARKDINFPVIAHAIGGLMKVSMKDGSPFIEGEARIAFNGFLTSDMLNFDVEKVRKKHYFV